MARMRGRGQKTGDVCYSPHGPPWRLVLVDTQYMGEGESEDRRRRERRAAGPRARRAPWNRCPQALWEQAFLQDRERQGPLDSVTQGSNSSKDHLSFFSLSLYRGN